MHFKIPCLQISLGLRLKTFQSSSTEHLIGNLIPGSLFFQPLLQGAERRESNKVV